MIPRGLNNDGVASTIGSVVLIAVVVAGMAILMVAVISQPQPQKIPAMTADVIVTGNGLCLKHDGGDSLRKGEFQIIVDGEDRTAAFDVPATWSVGQVLDYSGYDQQNIPRTIQIVYTGTGSGTTIVQLWVTSPTPH
ncbi:MAG TPA: type IV pilin N-terminal domain-containing protein [Methanoregula sp.]|nr:type IV pilin N-terminal domain-containing protein [Methanoregula sp.]